MRLMRLVDGSCCFLIFFRRRRRRRLLLFFLLMFIIVVLLLLFEIIHFNAILSLFRYTFEKNRMEPLE